MLRGLALVAAKMASDRCDGPAYAHLLNLTLHNSSYLLFRCIA